MALKLVCISEHFDPIVGGTVTYVKKTCSALAGLGHDVTLVYPTSIASGQKQEDWSDYKKIGIGIGKNIKTEYTRQSRYDFCKQVNEWLREYVQKEKVDAVHILFGLFLTETLDTDFLRSKNILVGTTIHNVPPQECGRSWKGDQALRYWKDRLRLQAVRWINHRRIRKKRYDRVIVPSKIVQSLLQPLMPNNQITVIGHGCNMSHFGSELIVPPAFKGIRFLTVGGFVPHKNQLLAVEVGSLLKAKGIDFEWHFIGPNRIPAYLDYFKHKIREAGLQEHFSVHIEVPFPVLVGFYQNSDVYVQLSREEGFCMTTLDAAMHGLPIVGTPAGAIPEIIYHSEGIVAEWKAKAIFEAIDHMISLGKTFIPAKEKTEALQAFYTWERAAEAFAQLYL